MFDRTLYVLRQQKARAEQAPLDQRIAEDLADRLDILKKHFDRSLLISDSKLLLEVAKQSGKLGEITCASPASTDTLNLPESYYGAILCMMDLHAVNDVPGYLIQLQRALVPDGLLILAFFAGETLNELRDSWLAAEVELTGGASPRVAPMISIQQFGTLLQRAGLALPVADLDRITIRYSDALSLMREVKSFGYANMLQGRSTKPASRNLLLAVAEHYQKHFADADGRVRATLEIAWANAWKPHPSQPQPLKPGSAKARLADALKVKD